MGAGRRERGGGRRKDGWGTEKARVESRGHTKARGAPPPPRERADRPLQASGKNNALWPVVLVTGVLPGTRCENMPGALMSYHSLRVKGSTLRGNVGCERAVRARAGTGRAGENTKGGAAKIKKKYARLLLAGNLALLAKLLVLPDGHFGANP